MTAVDGAMSSDCTGTPVIPARPYPGRSQKRRAARHLPGREAPSFPEFAARFFQDSRVPLAERYLPADPGGFHPDDRLAGDLRVDAPDSPSASEYIIAIEKERGAKIPDEVAERMPGFREVAEFAAPRPADPAEPSPGQVLHSR